MVLNWGGGWVSKWCAFRKGAVIRPINEACTNDVDAACPGYSIGQGKNSMLSNFTPPFSYNRADFPSYFHVFLMKVSKGNQNRDDKFNNSRIYLVQLSLSETQVHIRLHELNLHHAVLTQSIIFIY